jgi:hypothetical protein
MTNTKSMLLVKGTIDYDNTSRATFKMIPITKDCPYLEVIYHPVFLGLGIVSKFKKKEYSMIATLDKEGNPIMKKKKLQPGETPVMMERRGMDAWHEYVLITKEEMVSFVEMFASNADSFDYKTFFPKEQAVENVVVDMKATVTEKLEVVRD